MTAFSLVIAVVAWSGLYGLAHDPVEPDWRISLKSEDAARLVSGRVRFSTDSRSKSKK